MFEDQVDEQVEAADDSAADVEDASPDTGDSATDVEDAGPDTGDDELAAAVDDQAAASDGSAAVSAPEVPDDASEKIARAQEHIDNLNMDEERAAAKRAI
jgi:hypothetical protein